LSQEESVKAQEYADYAVPWGRERVCFRPRMMASYRRRCRVGIQEQPGMEFTIITRDGWMFGFVIKEEGLPSILIRREVFGGGINGIPGDAGHEWE